MGWYYYIWCTYKHKHFKYDNNRWAIQAEQLYDAGAKKQNGPKPATDSTDTDTTATGAPTKVAISLEERLRYKKKSKFLSESLTLSLQTIEMN